MDKEGEEVTVILASAKKTSVDAAVTAVLSELDAFLHKKKNINGGFSR